MSKPLRLLDPKAVHVSLDVEACGEVLVSIGAVEFDIYSGMTPPGYTIDHHRATDNEVDASYTIDGREFYCIPPIQAQIDLGFRMDGDAFLWWLKQSEEARKAVQPLDIAGSLSRHERLMLTLAGFSAWMEPIRNRAFVWAYPTSFDLPIIARLYQRLNLPVPWVWTQTMDARTLWQLALTIDPGAGRVETENPVDHHALEDAKEQAKWIAGYLRVLRGKE